jgi:hypothetical protein
MQQPQECTLSDFGSESFRSESTYPEPSEVYSLEPPNYEDNCFIWGREDGEDAYAIPCLTSKAVENHAHAPCGPCVVPADLVEPISIENLSTRTEKPQETVQVESDPRFCQTSPSETVEKYDDCSMPDKKDWTSESPQLGFSREYVYPKKTKLLPGDILQRRFRCPYGQRNALQKQSSCSGPGWSDLHRLK